MSAIEKNALQNTELLRFITAGSVDDGKSTLIGRLLYDSKSIFEDQLTALTKTTRRKGLDGVDLSLLTDGLQAEREQGITIDVAYRYFATPKRKFIIADTPGHEQYTRNMVTGASTANLAVILIDARKGVLTQSRRHAYIAALVGIPHLVVAVNKMDLVDYSQDVFNAIKKDFSAFAAHLNLHDVHYVPISALHGDMVVERGANLNWYGGLSMLELLESIEIARDTNTRDLRFPVQWVCRPADPAYQDFRGYMGRIESGEIRVGDTVSVLPKGFTSRVKEITSHNTKLELAFAPQSVTIQIEDHIDISRGDMLVKIDNPPRVTKEFNAMLCWLSETPLDARRKYFVKHTTKTVKGLVVRLDYRVEVNTLEKMDNISALKMNEIGRARLKVQQPLIWDAYDSNRATGSFILIDETTHNTVAAGMIVEGDA
ncbi:MAG: sulfate adenylyltransferase subunit CysN [Burkholderiales bacterium]